MEVKCGDAITCTYAGYVLAVTTMVNVHADGTSAICMNLGLILNPAGLQHARTVDESIIGTV